MIAVFYLKTTNNSSHLEKQSYSVSSVWSIVVSQYSLIKLGTVLLHQYFIKIAALHFKHFVLFYVNGFRLTFFNTLVLDQNKASSGIEIGIGKKKNWKNLNCFFFLL